MPKWKDIGTLLREYGLIKNDDLNEGLDFHKKNEMRLGEALVHLGKVSTEDIDWVLSKQLDVPFIIVEDVTVNDELLSKFQKDFLIDNRILPLYETDDHISIAIEDPFNTPSLDHIEELLRKNVNISIGNGRKIEELLKQTFKKVGLPELIDGITSTIERIKDTSFYRMDFILGENSCGINVFGWGILKNSRVLKGQFSNEEIFMAFDELNIPFLYEQSFGNNSRFVAIYPLVNEMAVESLPAVIAQYGLLRPDTATFSDAHAYGLTHQFSLENPVQGYPYIATKGKRYDHESVIYTIDAAPPEFVNFYVCMYIPLKCQSCNGAGCSACKDLGYTFDKIEGIHSSADLEERLREGNHGKD